MQALDYLEKSRFVRIRLETAENWKVYPQAVPSSRRLQTLFEIIIIFDVCMQQHHVRVQDLASLPLKGSCSTLENPDIPEIRANEIDLSTSSTRTECRSFMFWRSCLQT